MARSRLRELQEQVQERAAPVEEPEEKEGEAEEEQEENLESRVIKLQRRFGNEIVTRMLIQRFGLPSVPKIEEPKVVEPPGEAPRDAMPEPGKVIEQLPDEVRRSMQEAHEKAAEGESRKSIIAQQLKEKAKQRLGTVPPGKVNDPDKLLDRICTGLSEAWANWQKHAGMIGIAVNAGMAEAGTLVAPQLGSIFRGKVTGSNTEEQQAIDKLAAGFDNVYQRWQDSIKFGGQMLWPTFTMFPGPAAPPTPNVPIKLSEVFSEVGLISQLGQGLESVEDPSARAVVGSVAGAFTEVFPVWLARTLVINVMGFGPVPTFAPPQSMAGPVIGGQAVGLAGFLS